jgi:hypothetical protein
MQHQPPPGFLFSLPKFRVLPAAIPISKAKAAEIANGQQKSRWRICLRPMLGVPTCMLSVCGTTVESIQLPPR